jgi:hypothetical protein
MKIITNTSLQSWNLPVRTGKGVRHIYLQPNESIQVPASFITDHVIRFHERQLISIRNI